MLVINYMAKAVTSVGRDELLVGAIATMLRKKLSGLPVVDEKGELVGILSEGDLVRRVELGTPQEQKGFWARSFGCGNEAERYRRVNGLRVSDVMTEKPVTIGEQDTLEDAAHLMQKHRVKRLPVMRGTRLVGILTRADFMKALEGFLTPPYVDTIVCDDEIVRNVNEEMSRQGWVGASDVGVVCDNGKVTLTGTTISEAQRRAIGVAAEIIDGVRCVENLVKVLEPTPMIGL